MTTTSTEPQSSLRAPTIIRQALAAYRANVLRVAIAALLVLVPLDVLEAVTEVQIDTASSITWTAAGGRILLALTVGLGVSFGAMFFGGLLDRLVAEQVHGQPRTSLLSVLRTVPYLRLLLASLLLAVVTIVGLILLVLPGLLALTLFVLAGPMIAEGRPVVDAFRRSARIVWPRFWLVAGLVTVPLIGMTFLEDGLDALLQNQNPLVGALVVNGLVAATLGALVGLMEVLLTGVLLVREQDSDESR
jgi:hypothetical protein